MSESDIAGLVLKMEREVGADREADARLGFLLDQQSTTYWSQDVHRVPRPIQDYPQFTESADAAMWLLRQYAAGWELRSLSQKQNRWCAELVSPCGQRSVYAQRAGSMPRALIVVMLKVQLLPMH